MVVLERDLEESRTQLQKVEQVAGVMRGVVDVVRQLDRADLTHEKAYVSLVELKVDIYGGAWGEDIKFDNQHGQNEVICSFGFIWSYNQI